MFEAWLISVIRTVVPAAVGAGLTWIAARSGVLVDEHTNTQVAALAVGMVTSSYYALVRACEARWPKTGWLLGTPTAPRYDTDPDRR